MLKWALPLACIALVAAVFGLGSVAVAIKVLFCVFLVMFVAVLLVGLLGSSPTDRNPTP